MRRCRQVIAVGAVIMVAGLALCGPAPRPDAGVGWLVPGQPVNGLGMGTVLAPAGGHRAGRITPQHGRPTAGVLSTVQ